MPFSLVVRSLLLTLRGCVRPKAALQLAVLALRHQLQTGAPSDIQRQRYVGNLSGRQLEENEMSSLPCMMLRRIQIGNSSGKSTLVARHVCYGEINLREPL